MAKRIRLVLKKSPIGENETNRRTIAALGLKKIGQSKEFEASPNIMGMIRKVAHLVRVEEVEPRESS